MHALDLLLLGHLAKDEVVIGGLTANRVGGAILFGAHAAAASGLRCGVATKLAAADEDLLAPLVEMGVKVHWRPSRHTCGIRNIYTTADQDRRRCVLIHAGAPFDEGDLPVGLTARVIHVGPLLAGQVPAALLAGLARRSALGVDLQGFLRVRCAGDELELRPWPDAAASLACVTYLKADAAEAEVATGQTDIPRAAQALSRLIRPDGEVVLTHASRVTVLVGGELHEAPLDPVALEGRTGRGDTCMASYLAARLQGQEPAWAARYAAALTSIKLERDGPFEGTREQVLARMGSGGLRRRSAT
jgi:sugar/nucleoside kinase (ribokinase family)